jgi:DNA-binding FadR family transcriptional regulator
MAQRIAPIEYKSSYTLAATQIRRAIELGTYVPGDRLPPSRELAYQLGISVATLREAVRSLIDEGLLEMRRGPKGGPVVLAQPSAGRRRRASKAVVAEVLQVLELREAVESEAARLAAQRRSDDDLARMQQAFDAMVAALASADASRRAASFIRADSEFHAAIARATGNDLLVQVVEDARVHMLTAIGATLGPLTPDAHSGHDAILKAIRGGRGDAAARASRAHIEVTRAAVHRSVGRGA